MSNASNGGDFNSSLVVSAQGFMQPSTRRGAIRPKQSNSHGNSSGGLGTLSSTRSSSPRPQSAASLSATQKRIYEYSAKKFPSQSNSRSDVTLSDIRPKTTNHQEATTLTHTDHHNSSNPSQTSYHQSNNFVGTNNSSSANNLLLINDPLSSVQQEKQASRQSSASSQSSTQSSKSSSNPILPPPTTTTTQNNSNNPILGAKDDEVIIHVYDETNKVNKDFLCKRDLLLREMKYFRAYLTENCSFDDIDISVHCDVNIFQWLMDYIKNPGKPPKLDTSWAVSILISSDFLEMDKLVQTTLIFVHDRLQQIIKLPIELDCINNKLMSKLAKLFNADELDQIRDRRDKIISRLYMKKIEQLIADKGQGLAFCPQCKKVYYIEHHSWMVCPKAKMFINANGKLIAKHNIDSNWNVNKFIIAIKRNMSWKQVYWYLWGLFHCFFCTRCDSLFPASEMDWCSYHPKEATFETDTNVGRYSCCKSKAMRFDSACVVKRGCTPRNHSATVLSKDTSDEAALDLLTRKSKQICIPYGSSQPTGENEETFDLLQNEEPSVIEGLSDDEKDDRVIVNFHKYEIFHTYSRKYRIDGSCSALPPKIERKKKKKPEFAKMNATRKRFFFLDKQRDRDIVLMKNISTALQKCRKHRKDGLKNRLKKKKKTTAKFVSKKSAYNSTKPPFN